VEASTVVISVPFGHQRQVTFLRAAFSSVAERTCATDKKNTTDTEHGFSDVNEVAWREVNKQRANGKRSRRTASNAQSLMITRSLQSQHYYHVLLSSIGTF